MTFSRAVEIVNRSLRSFDIAIVRRSHYLEKTKEADVSQYRNRFVVKPIAPDAGEYLRSDNPLLVEYKRRYEGHPATVHSVWKTRHIETQVSLSSFRADNAYIWQSRDIKLNPLISYAFTAYYVKDIDALGLMGKLDEDGSFGAISFTMDMDNGKTVSRDLLDSIWEINFLERHLKLSNMPSVTVLDIGAGYGRLAYRVAKSLPNLKIILCADAVPESTFLCQYYLNYRGVSDRAKAVPLDTIEEVLPNSIDIVTNIHSFQECTFASISWWLDVISRREIKYFMLAHYKDELLSREPDGTVRDFRPLLEMKGFKLVSKESVYAPYTLASTYGLYPDRWYYLFLNERILS